MQGDKSQQDAPERSPAEIQALFESTADLIGRVAAHVRDSGIRADPEELLALGRQGLLEAAHRFDPSRGEDFRRFAYFRVRGSMIDGVRKMGPWSRRGYERICLLRAAAEASETEASPSQVEEMAAQKADELLKKHMAAMATAMTAGVFADHSIENGGEVVAVDAAQSVEELVADKQMSALVRGAIDELPPPEDEIVRRFYVEGEGMEAIARDFEKSKSWVSRTHSKALKRLGARLRSVRS